MSDPLTISDPAPPEVRSGRPSSRITVPEIAERLGIGRLAVYAMLEQGMLPGLRLGRRWIITWHAYEQWERTCGMPAGARSIERRVDWPDAVPTDDNELVRMMVDAIDDPETAAVLRFETLAGEALEKFVSTGEDIGRYSQILQYLVELALLVCPSPLFLKRISERQQHWQDIARRVADSAELPPRRWNIGTRDGLSQMESRVKDYERLAMHVMDSRRVKFDHPFQAADALLDSLSEYLLHRKSASADDRSIGSLCIASAEYCSELRTRALKERHVDEADVLGDLAQRFRNLAGPLATTDPKTDLYAYRRDESVADERLEIHQVFEGSAKVCLELISKTAIGARTADNESGSTGTAGIATSPSDVSNQIPSAGQIEAPPLASQVTGRASSSRRESAAPTQQQVATAEAMVDKELDVSFLRSESLTKRVKHFQAASSS